MCPYATNHTLDTCPIVVAGQRLVQAAAMVAPSAPSQAAMAGATSQAAVAGAPALEVPPVQPNGVSAAQWAQFVESSTDFNGLANCVVSTASIAANTSVSPTPATPAEIQQAVAAVNSIAPSAQPFLVDTGASQSMTHDESDFNGSLAPLTSPVRIEGFQGSSVDCTRGGTVTVGPVSVDAVDAVAACAPPTSVDNVSVDAAAARAPLASVGTVSVDAADASAPAVSVGPVCVDAADACAPANPGAGPVCGCPPAPPGVCPVRGCPPDPPGAGPVRPGRSFDPPVRAGIG